MKHSKFEFTTSDCGKRYLLSGFGCGRFHSLLFLGVAVAALMAGPNHANADGLTFNWTGAGNGTSFGKAGNFSSGYDADGNPISGPPNGLDNMTVTDRRRH